ncbi:MAG: hypothetical protein OXN16_11990 [Gammaproteobacteria bacterium]|nr:hypothetical protein [Gammaproteobacteria bacterium]
MKSIDKFVLVLVASLALLLAGCGGGSSTTEPVDPGPTPEEQQQAAIDKAVADALAAAEAERQAEADRMAAEQRAAEMKAMTAKLWAAIGETPLASNGTDTAIADDGTLTVQSGTVAAAPLEENEDATVASLHGWVGSEHTAEVDNDGTYTARLYSNVGEPTMGAKFNSGTGDGNVGFTLTAGVLTAGFDAANASRIASPMFDHAAGSKSFELPDPNPNGETVINIPGSYYGVMGTYKCTPGGSDCTATKAAGAGYTLAGGGTWTFTPDNVEDRVTEAPDTVYAVYGWWLHETADGATVSVFTGYRGTTEEAAGITVLAGSATYKGGAAGKYAVSAGAHNDSGHFTADAELKANFDTDMISGTINNFMGGDDMPRDWSVALKAGPVGDTGTIATVASGTTWTMGGTDAAASGSWSGVLYNNNDGGVPSAGTGTFHSEFGNTGRMVGAFGVDLEE